MVYIIVASAADHNYYAAVVDYRTAARILTVYPLSVFLSQVRPPLHTPFVKNRKIKLHYRVEVNITSK